MINDQGIVIPIEELYAQEDYSAPALHRKLDDRAAQFNIQRQAQPLPPPPIPQPPQPYIQPEQQPVILWETRGEGPSAGVKVRMFSNGKLLILFPPTFRVVLNTGEGPRENTANLYGYVEINPRPASGTQHLSKPSAPTQLHGED